MDYARSFYAPAPRSARLAGGAAIVALHVLALYGAMQLEPVRSAITSVAPIMVSGIQPERPKAEPPKPLPPKPQILRPQARPVPAPAPIITAAPTAPAVQAAPPPAPAPVEPAPVTPAPAPVTV